MRPLVIVVVMALLVGVGIYIGLSGLMSQYAFVPGRSSAGTAVCAPDVASVVRGTSARFSASGLPANALHYWASPEGRSEMSVDGKLSVLFTTPGTKTVSLFYYDRSVWLRSTCRIEVR